MFGNQEMQNNAELSHLRRENQRLMVDNNRLRTDIVVLQGRLYKAYKVAEQYRESMK